MIATPAPTAPPKRPRRKTGAIPPRHVAGKKRRFLRAYIETGNITLAAQRAVIERGTIQRWRNKSSVFDQQVREAEDHYADMLEREADRRAVDGTEEPVFYRGEKVGDIRRYSDTLLIFRLNGLRPDKYVHRTGGAGAPPFAVTIFLPENGRQAVAVMASPGPAPALPPADVEDSPA